ncbi:MAG TPA: ATP-binding protein [Methylomirabilota bacterium]|jgi:two-component system sensor histidine kinase AtoS
MKVLRFRSLAARLSVGTVLVVSTVMAGLIVMVERHQTTAIIEETERRGEVLARNLAAMSYGPLLLYNYTALEQSVARVAGEADVVYAVVLDAEGKVAAHSRNAARVGELLSGDVDHAAARTLEPLRQDTVDRRRPAYDFAVPVLVNDQKWGTVRVGLSKARMQARISRTRSELALLMLVTTLVAAAAAALVARRISRPVQQLADGAVAISRGDLNQRIEPASDDEIGRLAAAFNHMAAELARQHAALESANADLRRGLEELADLKGYTDNILASLTNGIVTVDLEGRVVTLNPAAELMTGFFAGEVAGRYCTEVFAQTPDLGEVLMATLANRTPVLGTTLILRRRGGRGVPVELSVSPLRGSEGKELGVIGVFRDLSRVRQLEERLRRSDRLAAVGELAAGLAHEIKNPLTSLLTFSRRLTRAFEDADFRQKFQTVVPRELERINGIVEGLLELARPARLIFKPVRVATLLERAVELYGSRIEAQRIDVQRDYARDLPAIWADQEALYQALVNLVTNALDAMPSGGVLILRAGSADAEGLGSGRVGSGRRVAIEIEDSGVGIPPAAVDRVFNPFFSTKDSGTGLGLALTYKIVDDHGGSIDVRSLPGVGTTFRLVLPVMPEAPPDPPQDTRFA